MCAQKSWRMWQGGNQWSPWDSFLTFFRDVVQLKLPVYEKYEPWAYLAENSGPRIMHEKFCIVSDRPERLLVDDQNRPHCDDGPFCRWRDGSELYAIHGTYVPAWVVLHPERITPEAIQAENNVEVRRIMTERYGVGRYLTDIGATIVDMDSLTIPGSAPRALFRDKTGSKWLVGTDGSTKRVYYMSVPDEAETCADAHKMISGIDSEHRLCAEA